MTTQPVDVIDLAQRVYRYRHGWILLDPRLATGRQHMRKLEAGEERKAGVSKPFRPSPRQARPAGPTRFRHGGGQDIAIDVAERRGLRQAENREIAREQRIGRYQQRIAKAASGEGLRAAAPAPSSRTHTARMATKAFGDANEKYSGDIGQVADKLTRNLRGRNSSDYQHRAAARLHAAAAKWQSRTPAERARHTKLAAMHRGIASRTPGRGTSTERGLRKTAASPLASATARRSAHQRLAGVGYSFAEPTDLAHVPIDPKIKLGSGGRFKKMKAKLAARGARNPGALAAFIGRRAYGAKKFGALSHGHAHSSTGPAVELAMRYPKYPVSSPYDVLIIRGEDGQAIIRHRRGGYEIARIRRTDEGSWVASRDGQDGTPHTRQRGALLEAIGQHNKSSGTPYHRPQVVRAEPLQPAPVQTELMAQYGIPAIKTLANPVVGASDGPRATEAGGDGKTGRGLHPGGQKIYSKLRKRGFPHERAHAFARRAQNRGRK